MCLSKKYYIEMAKIFNNQFLSSRTTEEKTRLKKVIDDFCIYLYSDNQSFNRDTFIKACGCNVESY